MAEIIRMPRLSDTMEEGNIVGWQKKVGDQVAPGDILAEVETDKATMDLESFYSGTLLHISVDSGAVPVDGIIAIIGDKKENVEEILASANAATEQAAPAEKKEEEPKQNNTPAAKPQVQEPVKAETPVESDRLKVSPLARKLASERGINLNQVVGTGDSGRIVKKDIEDFVAPAAPQSQVGTVGTSSPLLQDVQYGDVPVSQMRKVIARRLGESKFGAPHFYLTREINMDGAISARKAMNALEGVKVSFNDIVVKACAAALRSHPMINASWHGDKMTIHEDINIGVAVAVADGLLVPVIKHADRKSLSFINNELKTMAGKARNKKLTPDEMQGNTFTISNLGMMGIEEFTAIINPPDACILAVGAIIKKPVVLDGAITIGSRMKVTLSCDHRIVDGATGAAFLQTLSDIIENPVRMLV